MNKVQTFIMLMEQEDFYIFAWNKIKTEYYLNPEGYTLAEALRILSKKDLHNIMSDYWDNEVADTFKAQYKNVEGVDHE